MTPAWARRRSADEQKDLELEDIAADAREARRADPRELGRRMAALAAVATASARRSPHWERASAPEPMPPEARARWSRLVALGRAVRS